MESRQHATANSINTFATEVRDYRHDTPEDACQLICFLDERLSHWLLFAFMTGLITRWLIFDRTAIAPPIVPRHSLFLIALGIIYGIVKAYRLIEARVVPLIVPMFFILMGLWFWYWRRSALPFTEYLGHRPFTTFVAIMSISAVVTMVVWWFIFGGFPQPSEIFF